MRLTAPISFACCALAALVIPGARPPTAPAPAGDFALALPDGQAAKAWAGVGSETSPEPIDLPPEFAAGGPQAASAQWAAWAGWLTAAAGGEGEAAAAAGAGLARIAIDGARWEDAWRAFARLGGSPAHVAALGPHFLPGVPLDAGVGPGGGPLALPDGVLLRPATPPSDEPDPPGGVVPRRALARGFRIGAALIELELQVEPAGVQVDLRHLAGGPARFLVLLPEPAGQEIRIEYVDWMRQDALRAPLAVELAPGAEPVTLFGRFRPRDPSLPRAPLEALPRGIELGGLWIELGPLAGDPEPVRAAARALAQALGLPVELRAPLDPAPAGPYAGVTLRYEDPERGARLLRAVASAIEARLLR